MTITGVSLCVEVSWSRAMADFGCVKLLPQQVFQLRLDIGTAMEAIEVASSLEQLKSSTIYSFILGAAAEWVRGFGSRLPQQSGTATLLQEAGLE